MALFPLIRAAVLKTSLISSHGVLNIGLPVNNISVRY